MAPVLDAPPSLRLQSLAPQPAPAAAAPTDGSPQLGPGAPSRSQARGPRDGRRGPGRGEVPALGWTEVWSCPAR